VRFCRKNRGKLALPKSLPERVQAVETVLHMAASPVAASDLPVAFSPLQADLIIQLFFTVRQLTASKRRDRTAADTAGHLYP
jgi:hypothetical protein